MDTPKQSQHGHGQGLRHGRAPAAPTPAPAILAQTFPTLTSTFGGTQMFKQGALLPFKNRPVYHVFKLHHLLSRVSLSVALVKDTARPCLECQGFSAAQGAAPGSQRGRGLRGCSGAGDVGAQAAQTPMGGTDSEVVTPAW